MRHRIGHEGTGSMTDLIDALWARYRGKGDTIARAQLLDRYLGLVHHSAHQLARRISREVEIDDLIGAGTRGLVQALEGFDPGRGLAFSTYAMPRIRGSMLDELRARDWMPRSPAGIPWAPSWTGWWRSTAGATTRWAFGAVLSTAGRAASWAWSGSR